MRTRTLLTTMSLAGALLALAPAPASVYAAAQERQRQHIDVIEVSGLIDPVVADFVEDRLRVAERGEAQALVIQLDSGGGVVDDDRLDALTFRLTHATVPVTVWVGPSGARAKGQAAALVDASDVSGRADRRTPTLGDFVVNLDGQAIERLDGRVLHTAEVQRRRGEQPRRRIPPTLEVRFAKLGLVPRIVHTAASPSVAYVLFMAGLALVVLELYTAGIGLAALTGAGCLVLACIGLATLPTRPEALALLGLGMFGYAVDVQAGVPRTWTVIGTLATAAGSVRLYEQGLAPSWLVMAVVLVGVTLFMVAGMPAMVRSRFSTPTIGRQSMVGEAGAAVGPIDPEGTVEVRGARWRARTSRATPIGAGDAVRVVGIEGVLLEVEPATGGARDYRERRPRPRRGEG